MCNYPCSQHSIGRASQARRAGQTRTHLVYFNTIVPNSLFDDHSCEVSCRIITLSFSLRVNLDLGKLVYAYQIEKDKDIDGAVVRSSTIPEELGRIEYLFTDKTGTITKNGNLLIRTS